ncbi:MAG: thiamine-phosphate kinase [Pseudomonadota bacterium]
MDEFALIKQYFASVGHRRGVDIGVGDDAAVISARSAESWVVATDTLVAGVHFPESEPADAIGYRAVAVNVSDLAAMAAQPRYCTLALTVPNGDPAWFELFIQGFTEAAEAGDLALIGGDTTRGPMSISITVIGSGDPAMLTRRSDAAVGDELLVSGCLGDAAAGLTLLLGDGSPSVHAERLVQRFRRPPNRVALAAAVAALTGAAIDVSDGLVADAGHIAAASQLAIDIDANRIPLSADLLAVYERDAALSLALTGGDDYELLVTAPSAAVGALQNAGFTSIGRCLAGSGVTVNGKALVGADGYKHFGHATG